MYNNNTTIKRVKELITYNPDSGDFHRIKKDGSLGTRTGFSCKSNNYGKIIIDKSKFLAHRIAHLFMTEEWPKDQIDHINHKKNDNRWCNLRNATNAQNQANTNLKKNNTSGFKGVYFKKDKKKWCARIKINGKFKFLGYYDTPEEAYEAYKKEAPKHFGEFAFFG